MTQTLSAESITDYLTTLSQEQAEAVSSIRTIIFENTTGLVEAIDNGKWYTGLLTYSRPGGMTLFALGPRPKGYTTFHMMPYYGSTELQNRHGAALKRFLTGKSCIKFLRFSDLPEESLFDIIKSCDKCIPYR